MKDCSVSLILVYVKIVVYLRKKYMKITCNYLPVLSTSIIKDSRILMQYSN